MPDEDPFEEHLRAFYKKERELAGEEHAPSEEEWGLIQRKRRKEEVKSPREDERPGLWTLPRITFALGAACVILLIALVFRAPKAIQFAGLPPDETVRGGDLSLPEKLSLDSKGFLSLDGPEGKLEGAFTLTNSSPGLFRFETRLSGQDAAGPLRFSGSLILTNSAPSVSEIAKQNVSGALLRGDISRPGIITNTTARRYILQ